ncbi:MAG: GFA family protein, partial [Pseudomonadota bacterium]
AARWDYLPGQIYVPVGLFDRAEDLVPTMHAHGDAALPWLHIQDDLLHLHGSARRALNETAAGGDGT